MALKGLEEAIKEKKGGREKARQRVKERAVKKSAWERREGNNAEGKINGTGEEDKKERTAAK